MEDKNKKTTLSNRARTVHDAILYPRETKAIFGGSATQQVVHRVALFDKESVIKHIISQSDVARCCSCTLQPMSLSACT